MPNGLVLICQVDFVSPDFYTHLYKEIEKLKLSQPTCQQIDSIKWLSNCIDLPKFRGQDVQWKKGVNQRPGNSMNRSPRNDTFGPLKWEEPACPPCPFHPCFFPSTVHRPELANQGWTPKCRTAWWLKTWALEQPARLQIPTNIGVTLLRLNFLLLKEGKSLAVLQEVEHRITLWPCNSTPRCPPKTIKNSSSNICTCTFTAALFTISQNTHQQMNGSINGAYPYHGLLLRYQSNERRTDTCSNMDESCKRYAQWKKPITKGHTLYDSIHVKGPE